MSTLTAWKFPEVDGADAALHTLESLEKQDLITVHDGAIVTWPVDAKKPKTRQLASLRGGGVWGGAFWGFLFGLIFLVPLIGLAIGAAAGAAGSALSDAGIDDDFIRNVREKITPGTSALFVLTSDAVMDRVHAAFAGQQMELMSTNLTGEQDAALREAFGD